MRHYTRTSTNSRGNGNFKTIHNSNGSELQKNGNYFSPDALRNWSIRKE